MFALRINNLCWHIGASAILSHINIDVPQGVMLGVVGPNGAGKSSLLRCLYRYVQPSSGDIELFNRSLESYSPSALALKVAVVVQDTPINVDLTTEQLVKMGLTPHKNWFERQNQQDDLLIEQALIKVGLSDKASQKLTALSGGERQRALIARAIVQQPQLLILDEPTNHLDIRYQIQILELVKSLGITVIASIHDLNLASAMCDELVLLHQGKVVAHGQPKEVLTQQSIAEVFNVCCEVQTHPQHGQPLISYFYGYQPLQSSHHNELNHNELNHNELSHDEPIPQDEQGESRPKQAKCEDKP